MKSTRQPNLSSFFLLGIFLLLAFLLFTGAVRAPQPAGRYRMTVTSRNNFTDIYVIDTATGVVKYLGKDEGKPFDQVGGK